jgi:hypothetical protein
MPTISPSLFRLALEYSEGPEKEQLEELKDRLNACVFCNDKVTAAAFGYLLAMQEKVQKEPERETTIGDRVHSVVQQVDDGELDPENASELVFGLLYCWLDDIFRDRPFKGGVGQVARDVLFEAFSPYAKPGVARAGTPGLCYDASNPL